MSEVPILINSRAGALSRTAGQEQLQEMARQVGLEARVVTTEGPEEMCTAIRRLIDEGTERIAVAGGDGTVGLAVQELACTPAVLGIIPQGTANNFATALRLPQDLPSVLRVLAEGEVREVDLGKVGDRYFTESAGVGLFADALALYGGYNKNVFRAVYALGRVLLSMRANRLKLIADSEVVRERAVWCIVANSYRMAYALPVAPGARLTDGELDVVLVGNLKAKELLPYYRAIRAQLHTNMDKVEILKAKHIRIESRRRMNVHVDDAVYTRTPVDITAEPKALKVLVERL